MKGIFEDNDLTVLAKRVRGFWAFPPMFHAHLEIVYVFSGSIPMNIGGNQRVLRAGEMSVCCPYVIHSYEEAPEAEAAILLFSAPAAGEFQNRLREFQPVVPYLEPGPEILAQLERLLLHSTAGDPEREPLAKAYLSTLVGELLLVLPMEPVGRLDMALTQELLKYCREHYLEDISLASISRELHISESYITKIFAQRLGCPFRKYINRLRLEDARQLLRSTDKTVMDIMLSCGFNNQSSFNRVFQEEMGMTPREYRRQEKE